MGLEDIVLNEISEKNKYGYYVTVESKNITNEQTTKNRNRLRESKTGGCGGGEVVREGGK